MRVTRLEAEQIWGWLSPARRGRFAERARRVIRDRSLAKDPSRTYRCPLLMEDLRCSLPATIRPLACLSFYPDDHGDCYIPEGRHDAQFAALLGENRRRYGRVRILPIPFWIARLAGKGARNAGDGPRYANGVGGWPPLEPPARRKRRNRLAHSTQRWVITS